MKHDSLIAKYSIDDANISRRREFIRLQDGDRELLLKLLPWAEQNAASIAKEFYDWQFSFSGTQSFFAKIATEKKVTLEALRASLERAQRDYFLGIFTGAREHWGVAYFQTRLQIGLVHDKINLPFKWYIGSYTEYLRLVEERLANVNFWRPKLLRRQMQAIAKVFNYDIQAVGDAFLMSTFESVGLDINSLSVPQGQDRTECVSQIKEAVGMLIAQAEALSTGRLSDPALLKKVPGKLGQAFAQTVETLVLLGKQARAIADGKLDDPVMDASVPGELGDAFRKMTSSLTVLVQNIAKSASDLTGTASTLKLSSSEMLRDVAATSSQATGASAASEQVSQNVQSVATASEEMTAAIKEIAHNVSEASKIAGQAAKAAHETGETVNKLGSSSEEIDSIVKVITDIADQTNLLALNATIEAARAGEAGKGFAVVAQEVKDLAKETAKSAEEIKAKIKRIKTDTEEAVNAINQIKEIITKINDNQTTIAGAVEEQTATTNEIARSITEAAKGSEEIAQSITGVAQVAQSTENAAKEAANTSMKLGTMANELLKVIAFFRLKPAADPNHRSVSNG